MFLKTSVAKDFIYISKHVCFEQESKENNIVKGKDYGNGPW